jgi:hypothetical protein
MSYDLMVFDPDAAPHGRDQFLDRYKQTSTRKFKIVPGAASRGCHVCVLFHCGTSRKHLQIEGGSHRGFDDIRIRRWSYARNAPSAIDKTAQVRVKPRKSRSAREPLTASTSQAPRGDGI